MRIQSSTACRLLACAAFLTEARAQDWPGFRGPNSAGVFPVATKLPAQFDASTLAWSAKVPFGRSSPVAAAGQVILSATEGDLLLVLAFDARTGKLRWRYTRTRMRQNEIDGKRNDPASSTPFVDSTGIYAFFPDFGLVALDPRKGTLLWELALGPFINNYGMAASPVVAGETLFLQIDQTAGSYLLAVNRRTGAVRWKTERRATIEGWCTPILTSRGEVVALSSNGLEAFSAETGVQRWLVPAPNSLMIPVPLLLNRDRIIAVIRGSAAPVFPDWQATLRELDTDGDGNLVPLELVKRYDIESFGIVDSNRDGIITEPEWNAFAARGVGEFGFTSVRLSDQKVLWRYTRSIPYIPSPILYQGVLYSVRSGGILLALDPETGVMIKEARLPEAPGEYFASLIAGDGKVYAASAEGKITVIRPGHPWEAVASFDLGDSLVATPALGAGVMFVRTGGQLRSYRAAADRQRKQTASGPLLPPTSAHPANAAQ